MSLLASESFIDSLITSVLLRISMREYSRLIKLDKTDERLLKNLFYLKDYVTELVCSNRMSDTELLSKLRQVFPTRLNSLTYEELCEKVEGLLLAFEL